VPVLCFEQLERRELLAAFSDLRTATVVIESNDPDTPVFTFAIQGTATWDGAEVLGRKIVYGNSVWDGYTPGVTLDDLAAVAPDKAALLPGETASFQNISSYTRGLNELLVIVDELPGTPTAADVVCRVGNQDDLSGWTAAPSPEVVVRPDCGDQGEDLVFLTWADGAIRQTWLQVEILATENTGLPVSDVFYVGSAIGETGDAATPGAVLAADLAAIRDSIPRLRVGIEEAYDIDRSGHVLTPDLIACRDSIPTVLELITPPTTVPREVWTRALSEYLTAEWAEPDDDRILPRSEGWMAEPLEV